MSAACYHGNQVVYITKVVGISLSPTKIMRPRRAGPVAQMKKPTSRFPLREGAAAEKPVIERVLQRDGRLNGFLPSLCVRYLWSPQLPVVQVTFYA